VPLCSPRTPVPLSFVCGGIEWTTMVFGSVGGGALSGGFGLGAVGRWQRKINETSKDMPPPPPPPWVVHLLGG